MSRKIFRSILLAVSAVLLANLIIVMGAFTIISERCR